MLHHLYRASIADFLLQVDTRAIAGLLVREASEVGITPSDGEVRSWRNSLVALASVLRHPEFHDDHVFVELLMPSNSSRCDVLLTGRDLSGRAAAIVLELKQWQYVELGPYPEHVLAHGQCRLHPSAQVHGYVQHLSMFSEAFQEDSPEPLHLYGAVYLHNMPDGPGLALLKRKRNFDDYPQRYPIFGKDDVVELQTYLRERLVPGPGAEVADRIAVSRNRISPKLLDHVVATIEGEEEWSLLGRQKTAYWAISSATSLALEGEKASAGHRVIIVKGGPGTGKSVIAIQLLAHGARQGWRVVHAVGSKAFQTVLQAQMIKGSDALIKKIHGARYKKDLPVADLFTTFADAAKIARKIKANQLSEPVDLIVCDEAHRLWEYRRKKYPNGKIEWLTGTPMVEELLHSTRVAAFFLDDNQSVRPGEIGHSRVIIQHATRLGIPVEVVDLQQQFRCGGSIEYTDWVDAVLSFNSSLPSSIPNYDVSVTDEMPAAVKALELARLHNERCRIIAGYCWRWSKPLSGSTADNPLLVHDITDERFGSWSGAWIEKTGQNLKPLQHQYTRWAMDDRLYNQVGSIYSAQGFEFDRVLVIWGDDLVWREDRWVAQLDKNKDNAFKKEVRAAAGSKDPAALNAAALDKLRNVYRVLLTRGMKGTTLFILDQETRAYVRSLLQQVRSYRLAR